MKTTFRRNSPVPSVQAAPSFWAASLHLKHGHKPSPTSKNSSAATNQISAPTNPIPLFLYRYRGIRSSSFLKRDGFWRAPPRATKRCQSTKSSTGFACSVSFEDDTQDTALFNGIQHHTNDGFNALNIR